jgi:hypothetical protein
LIVWPTIVWLTIQDFGTGGDFGHYFGRRYFWGIPTSVVCQKDALIIAVTSVFFVSFVLSNAGTEFLGYLQFHGWQRLVGKDCQF